ncbi:uncharacterized protein LOC125236925 [Leguminivora glycinivorella]|uniref:uncharacterized protein LOC125236925 n=1 Tax=Leguminivora glycinivorella TaxID=1035111 RepID=UPI002010B0F4|nr:uncharacterized protein LOC125236925 [Leguminivora glycinivorella]
MSPKIMDADVCFVIGFNHLVSYGGKPELPQDGIFPFIVYFESRSRGICVGSLVSRVVVLTAAVCVTGPNGELDDKRPITVVTGTNYRHPSRGVRVQIIRAVIPKLPKDSDTRKQMLEASVALLLLRKRIPDAMVEQPLRAIGIDYTEDLTGSECVTAGWHFMYAEVVHT